MSPACGHSGVPDLSLTLIVCLQGRAPLGSLQEWIHMYGKHLDQETQRDCKETEKMLRAALEGRGKSRERG